MHPAAPAPLRRAPPGVALLRDGKLILANGALSDLTGYTRGELTSPESRLDHLVAGEIGWPAREQDPAQSHVELTPLRGERVPCLATTWRLGSGATLLLLEPHAAPREATPRDLTLLVARETIRACSSQMADLLLRLRRVQIQVESWEHAHPEVLEHELPRVAALFEELQRLDEDVRALALAAGVRR